MDYREYLAIEKEKEVEIRRPKHGKKTVNWQMQRDWGTQKRLNIV